MSIFKRKNPNMRRIELVCTGNGNGDKGCGTNWVTYEKDIFVTANFDASGETELFFTFRCPICGQLTDIPKNEISRAGKKNAIREYKKEHVL